MCDQNYEPLAPAVRAIDWNSNTAPSNGDHEEVDAARTARKVLSCEQENRSELPVRSVHDQDQFLTIDKTQDELGDQFLMQVVFEKSF
jgi:hypothetical protein